MNFRKKNHPPTGFKTAIDHKKDVTLSHAKQSFHYMAAGQFSVICPYRDTVSCFKMYLQLHRANSEEAGKLP